MKLVYRIAYGLMCAIGFTVKACFVLLACAIFALFGYGIVHDGKMLVLLVCVLIVVSAGALLFGWFLLRDWLEQKARRIT